MLAQNNKTVYIFLMVFIHFLAFSTKQPSCPNAAGVQASPFEDTELGTKQFDECRRTQRLEIINLVGAFRE